MLDAEDNSDHTTDDEMDQAGHENYHSDSEDEELQGEQQQENETDSENGEMEEEEDDNEIETEAWKQIIQQSIVDMEFEEEDIDELFNEPNFARFFNNLRRNFTSFTDLSAALKASDVFKKIKASAKQLREEDGLNYDRWEATQAAWDQRKNCIWRFLNENRDLFETENDQGAEEP
jgi:hypothetical protein